MRTHGATGSGAVMDSRSGTKLCRKRRRCAASTRRSACAVIVCENCDTLCSRLSPCVARRRHCQPSRRDSTASANASCRHPLDDSCFCFWEEPIPWHPAAWLQVCCTHGLVSDLQQDQHLRLTQLILQQTKEEAHAQRTAVTHLESLEPRRGPREGDEQLEVLLNAARNARVANLDGDGAATPTISQHRLVHLQRASRAIQLYAFRSLKTRVPKAAVRQHSHLRSWQEQMQWQTAVTEGTQWSCAGQIPHVPLASNLVTGRTWHLWLCEKAHSRDTGDAAPARCWRTRPASRRTPRRRRRAAGGRRPPPAAASAQSCAPARPAAAPTARGTGPAMMHT